MANNNFHNPNHPTGIMRRGWLSRAMSWALRARPVVQIVQTIVAVIGIVIAISRM